jgi:polysaccharide biosynthesis protein PslH
MVNLLSIVSYHILPAKMGGQKGIALFNEYISKHVNLTCVSIQNNETQLAKGYTFLNTLSNSKWRYANPFLFFTFKKILKEKDCKLLMIEHPYYGWLGLLLKWFCGVKLIVHSHNLEFQRFKSNGRWWWPVLKWYEKFVYRNADFVFFITDEDRLFAEQNWKISPSKATTITYGFELNQAPTATERKAAKQQLQQQYTIDANDKLLLFNGTLDYEPNLNALQLILEKINPMLMQSKQFYKIFICGKGLPAQLNKLENYKNQNIVFAGFVDDIGLYFKGCDIFLNPVVDGGGIKTKLVEALGFDMHVASTVNGAIGVPQAICNGKLKVSNNEDMLALYKDTISLFDAEMAISSAYFEHFYWGNIAKKAAAVLEGL